ncbi:hypothetical protein [Corynebacterium striatum]|uniref:hypothetical protein n=1 Tax=Corynebacterium striatum TaxID=43770 RepID=UPI003B595705
MVDDLGYAVGHHVAGYAGCFVLGADAPVEAAFVPAVLGVGGAPDGLRDVVWREVYAEACDGFGLYVGDGCLCP